MKSSYLVIPTFVVSFTLFLLTLVFLMAAFPALYSLTAVHSRGDNAQPTVLAPMEPFSGGFASSAHAAELDEPPAAFDDGEAASQPSQKSKNIPGEGLNPEHIPPRPENAPAGAVDLSAHYNAGLHGTWHTDVSVSPQSLKQYDNDLSDLGEGIHEFGGVMFDVRGLVQLQGGIMRDEGGRYPERAEGIPVGRSFTKMHALHAAGWDAAEGDAVAKWILHYADGAARELEIVYGKHLMNWWRLGAVLRSPDHTDTAWTGSNEVARAIVRSQRDYSWLKVKRYFYDMVGHPYSGDLMDGLDAGERPLRLFKTAWDNPRPDAAVSHIDYVSTMTDCAPFLVALTVE